MSLFVSTASPVHAHAHKTSSLFSEGDENAHNTHNTHNAHVFPRLQGASKALFAASPSEGLSFSFDDSPLLSHSHRQTHTHALNESRCCNDESAFDAEEEEDLLDSSAAALLDGFEDEQTHTLSLSDCEDSPSRSLSLSHTPSHTHTHAEEEEEAAAEAESESARKRRVAAEEERESERLAWQLMQEEEEALYNMQLQFMQTQVQQGALSDEDFRALQGLLQEPAAPEANAVDTAVRRRRERDEDEDGEEFDEEEQEEEEEEEEEEWDYDRLLALGQALGDVKTERWRMRAQQVIDALPVCCYKDVVKVGDEDADYRCVVCMDNFEEDEQLRLLPCKHFFHTACTAGWLADHNSCPSCKRKVTSSP